MRALITGGYGFVGRHLASHLVKCGDDVAVTYLPVEQIPGISSNDDSEYGTGLPRTVQHFALDITNREEIAQLISLAQPDAIYHLAARTFVPSAEHDLAGVFDVNVHGTVNIFDAVLNHSKKTKILLVSSSEVYGEPRPGTVPLVESAELRPVTTYGLSKACADLTAFKYANVNGLHIVRVRPFPHIGPGQNERFAFSSFSKQLAEIALGRREPVVSVGNLDVKRDYSDVSDIVRGYREALLNGKAGEAYNLCSAKSIQLSAMLDSLIKSSEVSAAISVDETRVRHSNAVDVHGSYQKAQKEFGWKPRIDLNATLHSMYAYWLEILRKK